MKSEVVHSPLVYRVKMLKRADGSREIIEVIKEGESHESEE